MSLPLGIHARLRDRTSTQRTAVLSALLPMLDKGVNDVVLRETLAWSAVQATEGGAFVWTNYDAVATAAADAGCKMWWVLAGPPTWATAIGAGSTSFSWACPPYPGILTAGGNSALSAFAVFAAAAANRYGPNGTFWASYTGTYNPATHFEIWDQEYSAGFSKRYNSGTLTSPPSDPAGYAGIYNVVAPVVRRYGAKPVASLTDRTANAVSGNAPYAVPFLAAVTEYIDAVSANAFPLNNGPASFVPNSSREWSFTAVRDLWKKVCGAGYSDADFWLTSVGWSTQPTGGLTEATQASRFADLWQHVQNSCSDFLDGLIIYNVTNPDAPDVSGQTGYSVSNPENGYALWHSGPSSAWDLGAAKPAVATITGLPEIDERNVEVSHASKTVLLRSLYKPVRGIFPAAEVTSDVMATGSLTFTNAAATMWNRQGRFNVQGQNWQAVDPADLTAGCRNVTTGRNTGSPNFTPLGHVIDFEVAFTGAKLGIKMIGTGGQDCQVYAEYNGDMYKMQDKPLGNTTTGAIWRNIVFASSTTRRVRIVGAGICFVQLEHEASAVIAPAPNRPLLVVDGDGLVESLNSYNTGSDETYYTFGICDALIEATGFAVARHGQGTTGYFTNGGGAQNLDDTATGTNKTRYFSADRINYLAKSLQQYPVALLINGTINDGTYSGGTIPMRTRCLAAWESVSAVDPLCSIIQVSPETLGGAVLGSTHDQNRAGHSQAIVQHPQGVGFIDVYNPADPWVTGTGYDNSPSTSQQAQIVGHDQINPNYKGAKFYGRRYAEAMGDMKIPAVRATDWGPTVSAVPLPPAPTVVTFGVAGAGASEAASDGVVTATHTCAAGDTIVFAAIAVGKNNGGTNAAYTRSVTFGGVPMIAFAPQDSGAVGQNDGFIAVYYLWNPPTGVAQSVVATITGVIPDTLILSTVSYTGVATMGTPVIGFVAGSAPSVTVASATNHMVYAAFCSGSTIASPTDTQRFLSNVNGTSTAGNLLVQDQAGATSAVLGAASNGDQWGWIAVDLVPSSGSVIVTPPPPPPPPPPTGGALIYNGDFSTGNFSQWNQVQCKGYSSSGSGWDAHPPTYSAAIVTDAVKGKAARFELRNGDQTPFDVAGAERTEVRSVYAESGVNADGDIRFYAFSTKFDSTFPANAAHVTTEFNWGLTNQFHHSSDTSGSPKVVWSPCSTNNKWTLQLNDNPPLTDIWDTPLNRGVWHDIIMEVCWSQSTSVGYIRLWWNGTRQTFLNGTQTYFTNTLNPGLTNVYYKEGIYRKTRPETWIIYHAGFRVATTFAGLS